MNYDTIRNYHIYKQTNASRYVHGMSETPTHQSWHRMRQSCYSIGYSEYRTIGEKGIKTCKRWDEFVNFLEDMGERPYGTVLRRLDRTKDFDKDNCKWVYTSRMKTALNIKDN